MVGRVYEIKKINAVIILSFLLNSISILWNIENAMKNTTYIMFISFIPL